VQTVCNRCSNSCGAKRPACIGQLESRGYQTYCKIRRGKAGCYRPSKSTAPTCNRCGGLMAFTTSGRLVEEGI